uniref:Uncharacterized protein n=1 Tax=Knipowitschia caucasica TaxID=637954 RepID=A0AAV2KYJ7_KNICA
MCMMEDRDYTLATPLSEDSAIEFDPSADMLDPELTHTPTKAPVSKKKKRDKPCEESAMESILKAVNEVKVALENQSGKLDTQTELLRKFEEKIEANTLETLK